MNSTTRFSSCPVGTNRAIIDVAVSSGPSVSCALLMPFRSEACAARNTALLLLLGPFVACREPLPPPSARTEIVALPNNLVVEVAGSRARAFDLEGTIKWQLLLPDHDVAVAPLSAARNSTTYVRGLRAVYALTPGGAIAWSHPLEPGSFPAERAFLYAAVALSDSGVALVVGRKSIVAIDSDGHARWREEIPSGDLVGAPRALSSGHLLVPTTTGLYAYTPSGGVDWRAAP